MYVICQRTIASESNAAVCGTIQIKFWDDKKKIKSNYQYLSHLKAQ